MTTSILDRVPPETITERARQAHPGETVARALAWLLLNIGFIAARACAGMWLSVAWAACALAQGWREGRTREWEQAVRAREARRARAGRAGTR